MGVSSGAEEDSAGRNGGDGLQEKLVAQILLLQFSDQTPQFVESLFKDTQKMGSSIDNWGN